MTKKNPKFDFHEIFDEHPIKACLGCFIIGIALSYSVLDFLYENKIENIKGRYENKIDFLDKAHKQDLQIQAIKIKEEIREKYYIKIDPKSTLGKNLSNLINDKGYEK